MDKLIELNQISDPKILDKLDFLRNGPIRWQQYSVIKSGDGAIQITAPLSNSKEIVIGWMKLNNEIPGRLVYNIGAGTSKELPEASTNYTIPANSNLTIGYEMGSAQVWISWGLPPS